MDEAKEALAQMAFLKLSDQELDNIKTLEDAKKALRENADRAYLDSQLKQFKEQEKMLEELLTDPSLSKEAVDKLKKDLDEVRIKITQIKTSKNSNNNQDLANVKEEGRNEMSKIDILGFTATQWADTFDKLETTKEKIAAVKMGIQAMANAFSIFSELQNNLSQREMSNFVKNQDSKKKNLEKQLKEGVISQEQYQKNVQLLDAETENKKYEIALRQAKMQKAQAIAQIAMNTAMAIMSIWAQVPKFDFGISAGLLTGIVAGLGAIQIGVIAAQPLPEKQSFAAGGYFEGYTGESSMPADETGERPIGLVKLHRKEWTAPRWMTEHPVLSKRIQELDYIRRTKDIPSFAEGGYYANTTPPVAGNDTQNNSDLVQYIALMSRIENLLQMLYDEGVEAFIADDAKNWKKIHRMNRNWENLETKNKH